MIGDRLYKGYLHRCAQVGRKPIAPRTFTSYAAKLVQAGLISREPTRLHCASPIGQSSLSLAGGHLAPVELVAAEQASDEFLLRSAKRYNGQAPENSKETEETTERAECYRRIHHRRRKR